MGLPVRERRTLDRIECALRGSDPKLAALYAFFARLNREEEMPRIEQLRHRAAVFITRLRLRLAIFVGRVFGRLLPRHRAVLFFPLALALAAVPIIFAARSSPGKGCTPMTPMAASPHNSSSKLCKNSEIMTPVFMSH